MLLCRIALKVAAASWRTDPPSFFFNNPFCECFKPLPMTNKHQDWEQVSFIWSKLFGDRKSGRVYSGEWNTIGPLLLSPNFRTQMITLAETATYTWIEYNIVFESDCLCLSIFLFSPWSPVTHDHYYSIYATALDLYLKIIFAFKSEEMKIIVNCWIYLHTEVGG